jgi:hypothetical protein
MDDGPVDLDPDEDLEILSASLSGLSGDWAVGTVTVQLESTRPTPVRVLLSLHPTTTGGKDTSVIVYVPPSAHVTASLTTLAGVLDGVASFSVIARCYEGFARVLDVTPPPLSQQPASVLNVFGAFSSP